MMIAAEPVPLPLQEPVPVIATPSPELAVAATLKIELYEANPDAADVTVIVCEAFAAVVVLIAVGAAL